jgi:hypothetical protein
VIWMGEPLLIAIAEPESLSIVTVLPTCRKA